MATRLRHNDIFNHPARTALFELVRETPGIAFLELYQNLRTHPEFGPSIGYGNLDYHLRRLEQFGLITNRKSARNRRYYENGGPWGGGTSALALVQTPPIPQLARIILDRPGSSQQELWQTFRLERPCSRQVVGYHLERLVRHELVTVAPRARGKAYYGTERLQGLLRFVREPPTATPPATVATAALAAVAVEA